MRRITQFISLVLLNSSWGPDLKWFCVPVLNCHSCALAWFACPIGVLIHYAGWHVFPFLALGTVLLFAVVFGRLLCGWVCPFGLVQDLLHKIPGPKIVLPDWTRFLKYIVLVSLVLLIPYWLGELTRASFCRVCPAAALQVTIPNWMSAGLHLSDVYMGIKLAILAAILALAVFSSRAFCRSLCPLGALLAPLNWLSFWLVKSPTTACTACRRCDRRCPTHCRPSERIARGVDPSRTPECILCYECQQACGKPAA